MVVSVIKKTLKAILPQEAIVSLRNTLDDFEFKLVANTSNLDFDTGNLKSALDISLDNIFKNPDIEELWGIDHNQIRNVFGDDDLMAGVNPGDRRAIYYLINALKPKNILEVGTHIGASTLYLAKALKNAGGGSITTVDVYDVNDAQAKSWEKYGSRQSPQDNLGEIGCEDMVTFYSHGAIPFMQETDQKFDFIFLDGDHSAAAVYKEVSASLKILNPGGVILLHDYYPDKKALFPDDNIIVGPWQAGQSIQQRAENIEIVPLGELPWETKQGVHATSLAIVLRK